MSELYIDQNTLAQIASTLNASSTELDASYNTTPEVLDAGTVTPSVLALLSVLMDSAGQLVVGMAASSAAVTEAATKYKEQDDTTADALIRQTWTLT
ncbi:hypothetical protein IU443_22245 [Nocardia farcinica]|uniref:hypothetical protein n=1 Tax=Nocardia farcinica TaxID=37329 RepID=UPI000A3BC42F|nr:hypothetical protein [Nocardia farcinica]MBA4858762.1 hypothetical protein [Nocardia farcinica]MBC9816075.1 hypothetical protein [Nocardia farcinica]MBF6068347.1 hypothetical protein [Nocardia farcinica]MBF6231532.1 hypothetical protein [Nocardia farcinica]MBF6252242.1 hypothetical protein [Nocardia farcinica]